MQINGKGGETQKIKVFQVKKAKGGLTWEYLREKTRKE